MSERARFGEPWAPRPSASTRHSSTDVSGRTSGAVDDVLSGFTMVPNAVLLDAGLSKGARLLYALLKHHNRNGACYPGQARLASYLGVSERTVYDYVNELVSAGRIKTRRQGRGRTNRYILVEPRPEAGFWSKEPLTGGVLPIQTGSVLPIRSKKTKRKEKNNSSNSARERKLAAEVLAIFNELAETDFRDAGYLDQIVAVIRQRPDVTIERHRETIQWALRHPWWKGSVSPAVLYANGRAFDRALNEVKPDRYTTDGPLTAPDNGWHTTDDDEVETRRRVEREGNQRSGGQLQGGPPVEHNCPDCTGAFVGPLSAVACPVCENPETAAGD